MIYAILLMITGSGAFSPTAGRFQAEKPPVLELPATFEKSTRHLLLFTPERPKLGRYEVFVSPKPLSSVMQDDGRNWHVETTAPLDAFGDAGTYDKAAVSRLYGGIRPSVARGWIQANGRFESLTFISPYPDPSLTRLEPGTLVIRFIICCT